MRLALLSLVGVLVVGCEDPQCTALSDCEGNQICVDGVCHNRAGGRPQLDSGFYPRADTGVAPDAGAPVDTGVADAGGMIGADAGSQDAGGSTDSGSGSLPTEGDLGFVWVGELIDGENTSAFHAFGLLQRLAGATYTATENTYPDNEATGCHLSTRRLTGGTVTGFEASEISVIPGPQAFSPFSMYPVGGGRFEPGQDPVQRIYNKSRTAYFQIFGTGNANSVDSMLYGVSAPPFVFEDATYPRGQPITIDPSPQLLWLPSDLSDGTITIEVFDGGREVVLGCRIADDGSYTIPTAAITAFRGAQPMPPLHLEIRYDREGSSEATIQGGGVILVTYRASQGLRYPVVLP